jgi:hypothetical protein
MARVHQVAFQTVGISSDYFPAETRETFGDLLVHLLYHEIDQASSILQDMTPEDLIILGKLGKKLSELSKVCGEYAFELGEN